jgi:hypothetical protein
MSLALTTTHENCYFQRSIPSFSSSPLAAKVRIVVFGTPATGTPSRKAEVVRAYELCHVALLTVMRQAMLAR